MRILGIAAVAGLIACKSSPTPPPPPPDKLVFVSQPTNSTAGSTIPAFQVAVENASGSITTGATTAVTIAIANNAGAGTLTGTTTVNAAAGVATFTDLKLDKAASGYTLSAIAANTSLNGATSSSFAVSAGAATKLAFQTQPGTGEGGEPFTPTVKVALVDAFNNVVTSGTSTITLLLSTNSAGATLAGAAQNAVAGVGTFSSLAVDRAATGLTLTATSAGMTSVTSATFDVHLTFASIAADSAHSCGVTVSQQAYCWGFQSNGLGDGSSSSSSAPVLVSGATKWLGVSLGLEHTCGRGTDSVAYCWGNDANKQLGNGAAGSSAVPTAVAGSLSQVIEVAAGWYHGCAVLKSGAPYCWGYNSGNQLGDGTTTDRDSPVIVGGVSMKLIAGARYHSCGISTAGGAYCWGSGSHGQGGGATATAMSGGLTFSRISVGGSVNSGHSCGIATGAAAYCWGANASGQLGSGAGTDKSVPTAVSGGLSFSEISVGSDHTCAITTSGALYCWGSNAFSQLGIAGGNASSPQQVGATLGLFKSVAAGDKHTCAVTAVGVAYCWGLNDSGQLGDGSTTNRSSPTRIIQ